MIDINLLRYNVETAKGRDDRINAQVACAFRWHPFGFDHWLNRSADHTWYAINGFIVITNSEGVRVAEFRAPELTSSCDEVLRFLNTYIPECWIENFSDTIANVNGEIKRVGARCVLKSWRNSNQSFAYAVGIAATRPLALLLAFLIAYEKL